MDDDEIEEMFAPLLLIFDMLTAVVLMFDVFVLFVPTIKLYGYLMRSMLSIEVSLSYLNKTGEDGIESDEIGTL